MNWTDEDREMLISDVVDAMVSEMTLEDMRRQCWDNFYEELICMEDFSLEQLASRYAPQYVK